MRKHPIYMCIKSTKEIPQFQQGPRRYQPIIRLLYIIGNREVNPYRVNTNSECHLQNENRQAPLPKSSNDRALNNSKDLRLLSQVTLTMYCHNGKG